MKKSGISLLLVIPLIFSIMVGCVSEPEPEAAAAPDPIELFYSAISAPYAELVMESLTTFGTNPHLGFRTSGSTAEIAASDYLYGQMQQIGLANVEKETIAADSWEFTIASLSYTGDEEDEYDFMLASYPMHFQCEDREIPLIYVGRGTERDYEGIDAEGKLALIDVNSAEDWDIRWPAYQAKLMGAEAVIVISAGGYAQHSDETLGIQNSYGYTDAPAFSISAKDGAMLKKFIEDSEEGLITVSLTSDSQTSLDETVYAVIGEIPGEDEGTICVAAHYDGYFEGFENNSSGVGTALGIAKALVDSGYSPSKTIRFILLPAYEWGARDSVFRWGDGQTFAIINIDGGVTCNYAEGIKISASWEISGFADDVGYNVEGAPFKNFDVTSPALAHGVGYPYAQEGIPVLHSGFSGIDEQTAEVYHTNKDTKDYLYNEEAISFAKKLYGTYLIELDRLPVKPLSYTALLDSLYGTLDLRASENAVMLKEVIGDAIHNSEDLTNRLLKITHGSEEIRDFNEGLFKISKTISEKLFTEAFVHERYQHNVSMLKQAIDSLGAGDSKSALSSLSEVDLNKYACHFDRQTCSYFAEQVSFAVTDLFDVVRAILSKPAPDRVTGYLDEMQVLEIELINQQRMLRDAISQMTKDVISITKSMELLLK